MDARPADRILLATIEALEAHGVEGLTVRGIARDADVNIAAISYYFGGKNKLVATALAATLDQAFVLPLEELDAWLAEGVPLRQALERLLEHLVAGALRYPTISRAHLSPVRRAQGVDPLAARVQPFIEAVARQVEPAVGRDPRLDLAQILQAVLFIGAEPDVATGAAGLDLRDRADRTAWIDRILTAHLPELASG